METKRVLVPSIAVSVHLYDKETQATSSVSKHIPRKVIVLDAVEQEVRQFDGVVPDIVAVVGGKLLLIEIAVTHFVDDDKLEKLKRLGYPVMEIFIDPENELPSLEEIERLVTATDHNRLWLINPKKDRLEADIQREAEERLNEARQRVFMQRREQKETHEKYLTLTDSQKLVIELETTGIALDQIREIIGYRVSGDKSFGVSNQVWQTFIYREFIHRKLGEWFHADDVFTAMTQKFNVAPTFKDSPQIAIYYYLKFLEEMRMVQRIYSKNYEVLRRINR